MNDREARQMLKRFRKKSVAAVQLVPHLPPEGQVPTGAEKIPPPPPLNPSNLDTAPLESLPAFHIPGPLAAPALGLSSTARQVASEREALGIEENH